jgi:hypothetical protein
VPLFSPVACAVVAVLAIDPATPAGAPTPVAPAVEAPGGPDKAACARSAEDGQRLRTQGKLREAREAFAVCAADGCPALIRNDCGGWLAEVQSAVPTVVVRATAAEDPQPELYDVEVEVDGAPLTSRLDGRALPVNPGERRFSFTAAGRRPVTQTVVVRVGEQHRLLAVTLPSDHPLPAPPRPPLATAPRALLIGGGAALAVSAGFGVAGWLEARSLHDRCAPTCAPGEVDGARRLLRVADVALGVGAASLAAAAALIWARPAEPGPRVAVMPLARGALLALRWGGRSPW